MKRLTVALLSLAVLIVPLAAVAQPARKVYRIGVLNTVNSVSDPETEAFVLGLRDHGYEIGRNVIIEIRGAAGKRDQLPALATELVRLPVDLIVTTSDPAARAAKDATTTIPILMAINGDPVIAGLVDSIAHPGGNITGLMLPQLAGKRLELLREFVPGLQRVAGIRPPGPTIPFVVHWVRESETAAQQLGLQFQVAEVPGPDGYDGAFAKLRRGGIGGVTVMEATRYGADRQDVAAAALKHRLPTVWGYREHVDAGGLISYSANVRAMFRRAGALADKILRGTPPARIPIEQPSTFDLVINRTTAKTLGLTIPPSVLLRATDVIE